MGKPPRSALGEDLRKRYHNDDALNHQNPFTGERNGETQFESIDTSALDPATRDSIREWTTLRRRPAKAAKRVKAAKGGTSKRRVRVRSRDDQLVDER